MESRKERRIKEIEKSIMMINVYDFPGMLMFGLAIYAKFMVEGEPFHPLLANEIAVDVMLGLGIAIMLICGYQVFKLSMERKALIDDEDT